MERPNKAVEQTGSPAAHGPFRSTDMALGETRACPTL